MEPQNPYLINANEYPNIDTAKISKILLKDGTVLQMNKNYPTNIYGNRSHNRNVSDSSIPVNNLNHLAKVKKFNSFSSNIKYKSNFNNKNQINGFYVTPIINGNRKLIAIKVPEINPDIELSKDNYHVENYSFKVSPKKYNYKPYKPPKRKHNLVIATNKQNYNFYCSKPNFINNKK